MSYENGAQYVILFNYAESMSGPYGTLQDEHFQALERFWNEVVQNPIVVHGGVKAQTALVLPENYGWGMRNPNDVIWGIWEPNSASSQTWIQVQSKLEQYGSKLDIVYDDPAYPATGKYNQIYYLNQPVIQATPLAIGVSVAAIVIAVVTFIVFRKRLKGKSP
jgi:hypothetical protein